MSIGSGLIWSCSQGVLSLPFLYSLCCLSVSVLSISPDVAATAQQATLLRDFYSDSVVQFSDVLQARFSTFVWVQALDLAIVTARSGALCTLPYDSCLSVRQCLALVFTSHFLLTYVIAGSIVWYMDREARRTFLSAQATK